MARALKEVVPAVPAIVLALMSGALLLRIALAAVLPPGADEAYAVAVARGFSLSYVDHPPLGFWLPAAAAWATGIEHALVYRLPALLLGTLTALAVWRMGVQLGGAGAGLWALILFLVAPHMVLGSSMLALPDAPLNAAGALFGLAALALIRAGPSAPLRLWLLAGTALAVAAASKYNAVFLGFGLLGFLLVEPAWRRSLRRAGPWLLALVAATGALPVVIWNLANDGASFSFHGQRSATTFDPVNLLAMTGLQSLYLLPPVMAWACVALWHVWRGRATEFCADAAPARLLTWLALSQILPFSFVYLLGGDTFAHWTMPGWFFALPLAGAWLAHRMPGARRHSARWLAAFALPAWLLLGAGALHVNSGALARMLPEPPAWDDTSGLFHWHGLQPVLARGSWLEGVQFLVAESWVEGGFMSTALEGRYPVRILGGDARHFARLPGASMTGQALLLVPARIDRAPGRAARARDAARAQGAYVISEGQVVLPRGAQPHVMVVVMRLHWPSPRDM